MTTKAHQSNTSAGRAASIRRRLAPPVAFLAALCLMVVCFYDSGYTSLPPTGKRYELAKTGIQNLRQDAKRAGLRESWEKLAAEFQTIYDSDPAWPNRPAALFRAAEALEELAHRSFAKADARKAIECYEKVAQRHADSRLADDALFRAAKLRAAWLKDDKGALRLLERIRSQYPKSDMRAEAQALEKTLLAAARGRTAPEARQVVGTDGKEAVDDQASPRVSAASRQPGSAGPPQGKAARQGATLAEKAAGMAPLPPDDLLPRYREAKNRMESLRADKVRSCQRQPWEDLTTEFLRIYQAKKNWAVSPGALYRAAASLEALADCSHLKSEYRQARDLYLGLAQEFPASALADDALLRAADIDAGKLNQTAEALELLDAITTLYAGGDQASAARALRTRLSGKVAGAANHSGETGNAQPARPARPVLTGLSWNSLSKDSVEIVLEMSAPARYVARLETPPRRAGNRKEPAVLRLSLENAAVADEIRKGLDVRGSLFKRLDVAEGKSGKAELQFSFQDARRFDARSATEPCRIILRVAAGTTPLPPDGAGMAGMAKAGPSRARNAAARADGAEPRLVSDMARQLGLTVRTVFIDAGHGGRDPGTQHNNVLEREIALDVAMTLGRLLQANGMDVVYSRTGNSTVPLQRRTVMANEAGADLFVSIHVNANPNAEVQGFETYYLDIARNPEAARLATLENAGSGHRLGDMQKMLADVMLNARVDESRHLAADIQRRSLSRLKRRKYAVRDNGVKSAPFLVLLGAQMPAVLVELGYCTHKDEARNLLTPQYRMALAEGLAEGVLAYRDRLLKRRTVQNSLTPDSADAM